MTKPFVITVASEKGGVGKTTIATNLAVYLKALQEDLPVTIASFDNHFSVDQMFALGPRPRNDMSAMLQGARFEDLVNLGQYGVQYIASSRRLTPPTDDPAWLSQRLAEMGDSGILILDTRPILDWFSEAALRAADLVLVPIKDRAALINADALRQVLLEVDRVDSLWLLPSLVDTRARLNSEVKVHQFLSYAARERDYQVLDIQISKSPKVEGLASGFSSCIRPVLTHARNTAVHSQFRKLAEFVLHRYEQGPALSGSAPGLQGHAAGNVPPGRRNTILECPACGKQAPTGKGHFALDMRSRRRGHFHHECYLKLVDAVGLGELSAEGIFVISVKGPGLVDMDTQVSAYSASATAEIFEAKDVDLRASEVLSAALVALTGRSLEEAYRETVVINCADTVNCGGVPDGNFTWIRRQTLRELHQSGQL